MTEYSDYEIIHGRDPYRLKQIKERYGNLDKFFFEKLNELQTIEAVKAFLKHDAGIECSERTISRYIAGKLDRRTCWIATEYLKLPPTSQDKE